MKIQPEKRTNIRNKMCENVESKYEEYIIVISSTINHSKVKIYFGFNDFKHSH